MAARRYRNPASREKKKTKGIAKNPTGMMDRNSLTAEESRSGDPLYPLKSKTTREWLLVQRIGYLPHFLRERAFDEIERVLEDMEFVWLDQADQMIGRA